MPAALPLKHPVKVGQLVRRRLRELKRTPRELAEAVQVSEDYIVDLVAGRRRPPAPGRIDLYAPMARFLRLHRNDLPTCARVERLAEPAARRRPDAGVWKLLNELCEPRKARRRALLALDDVELNALALGQRLESVRLDRGVVNEAVLLAVLGGDETESLRVVEPLHDTGDACHLLYS